MDRSLENRARAIAEKLARGHPNAEDLMMASGIILELLALVEAVENRAT